MTRPAGRLGQRRSAGVFLTIFLVVIPDGTEALGAGIASYVVSNDAVAAPLDSKVGDATRGRAVVLDRQVGNCLICHAVPNEPKELFQGNIGPSFAGIGSRLSPAQIRLRVIDQRRLNPASVMPSFYRVDGLNRVAARYAGAPALDAQQIEDIVAYLATLRN